MQRGRGGAREDGMATLASARRMALRLPDVTEQDHHGRPSFRVAGKIFTTVPDDGHVNVFCDLEEVPGLVAQYPACAALYWGKRLRGVRVELASVDAALLRELLTDAWRMRAGPGRGAAQPSAGRRASATSRERH
jgi:hypothetical protein